MTSGFCSLSNTSGVAVGLGDVGVAITSGWIVAVADAISCVACCLTGTGSVAIRRGKLFAGVAVGMVWSEPANAMNF